MKLSRNKNCISLIAFCVSLIIAFSTIGCGNSDVTTAKVSDKVSVYYLDADAMGLESVEVKPEAVSGQEEADELFAGMAQAPADSAYIPLLPEDVTVNSYNIKNTIISVDFSADYNSMSKSREVLVRAGIVRTLIQIGGIKYVEFSVEGQNLQSSDGSETGLMDADTFIENTGRQINSYQHTNIDLYYANSTGDQLVKESRSIYYSSNKTLEWAIMERLIAGPKVSGNGATIPSETQILGVSTQDNVCYVNLSKDFVSGALNLNENLPIYSIVNSLIDNCHIKQVQIAIEGVTDMTFRDHMSLNKLYQMNQDIVAQ